MHQSLQLIGQDEQDDRRASPSAIGGNVAPTTIDNAAAMTLPG